jgi:hypothetical protein
VQAPQVVFNNNGSGQVQLDWTGGSPVVLSGGQSYTINGTAAGLTVMLLTTNADYTLQTNGSIDTINAATGVTAVNLMVDTGVNDTSYAMWVGDGHVGNVNVPTGSNVNIYARGDLWNLNGPSSNGTMTGVTATDLVFANLDGSIAGVDAIQFLTTSGWLGTSASQQVEVAAGISNLSAYGVGATVIADARQNAGDAAMAVTVGDGGVPGEIDGGNVSNARIAGNVNAFNIQNLEGNFDPPDVNKLTVTKANANSLIDLRNVKLLNFDGKSPEQVAAIKATGTISKLQIEKGLTVNGDIVAEAIGNIQVDGAGSDGTLKATNISTTGNIGSIKASYVNVTQKISAAQLGPVTVDYNLKGNIQTVNGSGIIDVGGEVNAFSEAVGGTGDFIGSVTSETGNVGPIYVHRNFAVARVVKPLVEAHGVITAITAGGDIGSPGSNIYGNDIGIIQSTGGSILLSKINASVGFAVIPYNTPMGRIKAVLAKNVLKAALETSGGSIGMVVAGEVAGDIKALASNAGSWSPNTGGDINYVNSAKPIPKSVSFKADWYVGKIVVQNPDGAVEKFGVYAQGGQLENGNGFQQSPGALVIDVGAGTYLGTVRFTAYGINNHVKTLGGQAAVFQPNTTLLTVKEKNKTTVANWTLTGPAGQTTNILNALFTQLKNGAFGWVKNKNSFSNNQFSIAGPSGNQ